jgi:hypothetical protein
VKWVIYLSIYYYIKIYVCFSRLNLKTAGPNSYKSYINRITCNRGLLWAAYRYVVGNGMHDQVLFINGYTNFTDFFFFFFHEVQQIFTHVSLIFINCFLHSRGEVDAISNVLLLQEKQIIPSCFSQWSYFSFKLSIFRIFSHGY